MFSQLLSYMLTEWGTYLFFVAAALYGWMIPTLSPCLTSVTQFDQVEIIGSSRDRSKHFPDTGLGGSGSDYPWFGQL